MPRLQGVIVERLYGPLCSFSALFTMRGNKFCNTRFSLIPMLPVRLSPGFPLQVLGAQESTGNSIKNEFRGGQRGSGSGLSGRFQWVEPKVAWPSWCGGCWWVTSWLLVVVHALM